MGAPTKVDNKRHLQPNDRSTLPDPGARDPYSRIVTVKRSRPTVRTAPTDLGGRGHLSHMAKTELLLTGSEEVAKGVAKKIYKLPLKLDPTKTVLRPQPVKWALTRFLERGGPAGLKLPGIIGKFGRTILPRTPIVGPLIDVFTSSDTIMSHKEEMDELRKFRAREALTNLKESRDRLRSEDIPITRINYPDGASFFPLENKWSFPPTVITRSDLSRSRTPLSPPSRLNPISRPDKIVQPPNLGISDNNIHTVKSGEVLSRIAMRNKCSVNDIEKLNPWLTGRHGAKLKGVDFILPGDKIALPTRNRPVIPNRISSPTPATSAFLDNIQLNNTANRLFNIRR